MSLERASLTPSSSHDEMDHLADPKNYSGDKYEYLEPLDDEPLSGQLSELDLGGDPVFEDDTDNFDYPQTEKQFGEVVVVMRHIQKGTRPSF